MEVCARECVEEEECYGRDRERKGERERGSVDVWKEEGEREGAWKGVR